MSLAESTSSASSDIAVGWCIGEGVGACLLGYLTEIVFSRARTSHVRRLSDHLTQH